MHTEQYQINLGSKVRSLSFSFLLNTQAVNANAKKIKRYMAMACEKSMLIIFCREVNLHHLPVIRREACLLYKKVVPDIAGGKQVYLQIT